MRPAADSGQQKQQVGEPQMRVIPFNKEARACGDAVKPSGFWQRLATAIDSLATYPVEHALSEREKRQVDDEIARCRQLMSMQPRPRHVAIRRHAPARVALARIASAHAKVRS
jgi:hypothetical protein